MYRIPITLFDANMYLLQGSTDVRHAHYNYTACVVHYISNEYSSILRLRLRFRWNIGHCVILATSRISLISFEENNTSHENEQLLYSRVESTVAHTFILLM